MCVSTQARLDTHRAGQRRRDKAQAKLAKALDAHSVGALAEALADAAALGLAGDAVDRARALLARLKEEAAGAILTATTASAHGVEHLPALAKAIERARQDGVNAHMIAEAEARYAHITCDVTHITHDVTHIT